MKAIVQHEYGRADVLRVEDVPRPEIQDCDVLVRVHAASLNPADWHFMRGSPWFLRLLSGVTRPKQGVRGIDLAGRVEAVGKKVTRLEPGDEVFGAGEGVLAEYARVDEGSLMPTPAGITHEQAAAAPLAGCTALQGLRDQGRIKSGQRVLIIGASGGVGTFAVQIAKFLGAEVTSVCSTKNVDLVHSLGSDHVIDYTREDLTRKGPYDLVFQLAGTAYPSSLRRALTSKGTLVLSSGEGRFSGIDRLLAMVVSSAFVSQRQVTWVADTKLEDLAVLAGWLESGAVEPVIDRTYGFEEAPEAMRYVEQGHTQGKVVVRVGDNA